MTENSSQSPDKKPLSRRNALLRIGGVAMAAYVVPSMTVLSAAHASGTSAASKASKTSRPSPASGPSAGSGPSGSSGPSSSSGPSGPSSASGPSSPSGPSSASGPSRPDYSHIVDEDSCVQAGGRFDADSNTCRIRRR